MNLNNWQEIAAQCQYEFPDPRAIEISGNDVVCIGADLEPSTLLYAYSHGLFPMYESLEKDEEKILAWLSPERRGIFRLEDVRVTRSLTQSMKKYDVRIDSCFVDMMMLCKTVPRKYGWITDDFIEAYTRLHEMGFAHSVEVFREEELVGGLYGVSIGGLFAGESMVHIARDASKVALVHLVEKMRELGLTLLDAQWINPHLASMGATEIPRDEYLTSLGKSLKLPSTSWV